MSTSSARPWWSWATTAPPPKPRSCSWLFAWPAPASKRASRRRTFLGSPTLCLRWASRPRLAVPPSLGSSSRSATPSSTAEGSWRPSPRSPGCRPRSSVVPTRTTPPGPSNPSSAAWVRSRSRGSPPRPSSTSWSLVSCGSPTRFAGWLATPMCRPSRSTTPVVPGKRTSPSPPRRRSATPRPRLASRSP